MLNKTYSSIEETSFITVSMKDSFGYNTGTIHYLLPNIRMMESLTSKNYWWGIFNEL